MELVYEESAAGLLAAAGWTAPLDLVVPDEVPEWLFAGLPEEPACELCGAVGCLELVGASPFGLSDAADLTREEGVGVAAGVDDAASGWAVPGVTGLEPQQHVLPPVSDLVADVQRAVAALAQVDPTGLPAAQALVDAQALLAVEQELRVLDLHRTGDVVSRGLHELVGFRSATSWLRAHRPDGDASDATLASTLRGLPVLAAAVRDGLLPLASAKRVAAALRQVTPHLDQADGRIDEQSGDEVLTAVVSHVIALCCREVRGMADDDPRLLALVERGRAVLSGASQAEVVEAAFTWLAEELPVRQLPGPLDELVMALLPSQLDERDETGRRRRSLSLTPLDDGTGWRLEADLDLECGERLWVALRAEAQRDAAAPDDTAAWAAAQPAAGDEARAQVSDAWGLGLAQRADGGTLPRARRQRLHDAFSNLLDRYLSADLGGRVGKNPVQVSVTLSESAVTGRPGAAPATTSSGALVPSRVVRRWWCDASVTGFVLSLGGRVLRAVHAQRTLTGLERTALQVEGGSVCVGDGCCTGRPDPLTPIRPHHVHGFAENLVTSLDDTLPVCDALHHAIHEGHTIRLRDGRYVDEHGWVDEGEALRRALAPPPF